MFDTVLGSIIILLTMLAIIFVLALVATAWLRGLFLKDEEATTTASLREPSAYAYRKAA